MLRWTTVIVCAMFGVFGISSAAKAGVMYTTAANGSTLATVDTNTGTATAIGAFQLNGNARNVFGLAFAPDGSAYGLLNNTETLVRINMSTAALTVVGGPGTNNFGYALDFWTDGTLYALSLNGGIYAVNTTTGAFTYDSTVTGGTNWMDFTVTPQGEVYAVNGTNQIFRLNTGTGVMTSAYANILGNLMGIASDSAGHLIASSWASPSQVEAVNLALNTSSITTVSGAAMLHGGDIFLPTPEPGACSLAAAGLAAIVWTRRRVARR